MDIIEYYNNGDRKYLKVTKYQVNEYLQNTCSSLESGKRLRLTVTECKHTYKKHAHKGQGRLINAHKYLYHIQNDFLREFLRFEYWVEAEILGNLEVNILERLMVGGFFTPGGIDFEIVKKIKIEGSEYIKPLGDSEERKPMLIK